MDIKNAVKNIHVSHEKDQLNPLLTPWGETLDQTRVWEEHPRPQMQRSHFQMLNGLWDYCIVPVQEKESLSPIQPGTPFVPDGQILVPFSPEASLSGVNRLLKPDEFLWYQRKITPEAPDAIHCRCLLHFDAVDQEADVYINGVHSAYHLGGYLPFTVELPLAGQKGSPQELLIQVRVRDLSDTSWRTRGKQMLKRGGMFYTAQSGIWQSVWCEWVPESYVETLQITPDYDSQSCEIILYSSLPAASIQITDSNRIPYVIRSSHSQTDAQGQTVTTLCLSLPEGTDFIPWTPQQPHLYPLEIRFGNDEIHSYFAMRHFSVETGDDGIARFCLNHMPLFLHGILDQGYWPDGLMTAPCDDALIYDIELVKSFGFNMIRKHIKIEPMRWYYHCDRLGMIVWQDMVNGGTSYHMPYVCYLPTIFPAAGRILSDKHYRLLSRTDKEGRIQWLKECMDTVRHLKNVPSLAVWVPFNEAWGQFDALEVTQQIRALDPTRPIDHASGWFDQKGGDFRSIHNYFRPLKVYPEEKRAFVISEYGGYACHVPGHSSVDRIFGYKQYETPEQLSQAYTHLMNEQLLPLSQKGLSGAVYTQLSDIEEEVNGLVTYDRRVVKIKQ